MAREKYRRNGGHHRTPSMGGSGLVKIAAFPFIRSKDSIEVAWLTHSHVCTPFSSLPLLRIITLYQGVRQSCHLEEDAITCGAILHMILCKKPCFPRVGVFHRKLKSSQSQQSQARGRHSALCSSTEN